MFSPRHPVTVELFQSLQQIRSKKWEVCQMATKGKPPKYEEVVPAYSEEGTPATTQNQEYGAIWYRAYDMTHIFNDDSLYMFNA